MFLYLFTLKLDESEKKQITDIYNEYGCLMKIVAMQYFKDSNIVKDVIQESFFKIRDNLKKILSLKCNEKRTYIVNIVKGVSIDYIRKENIWKKHTLPLEGMEAEIASKELSLEEYIIREELRLSISNQMLKLSERDVIVLKAKYYHGCTTREICEMIGVESEATVRSIILRARKRLFKLIRESDGGL